MERRVSDGGALGDVRALVQEVPDHVHLAEVTRDVKGGVTEKRRAVAWNVHSDAPTKLA